MSILWLLREKTNDLLQLLGNRVTVSNHRALDLIPRRHPPHPLGQEEGRGRDGQQ
jgi:hypothetical protein